ncbi:MAG: hypothetical protein WCR56_06530, partial [Bacilli bacterium]
LASDYFEKLNAYCFSSTDGISTSIVYRSDFTSELVAGVEHALLSNTTFATYFSSVANFDFLGYDTTGTVNYQYVNPIEGRGIDALVSFATLAKTLSTSKLYFTYLELSTVFTQFGNGTTANISDDTHDYTFYNYFLTTASYSTTGNSYLGLAAKDTIFGILPIEETAAILPETLATLIPTYATLLSTSSFKAVLDSVSSQIK